MIKAGKMQGGKTYTVKVIATVIDDPTITVEATITIRTISKDLQPVILRAPAATTGEHTYHTSIPLAIFRCIYYFQVKITR